MEEAALRVFSNAEGAYGSNVNALVDSGAWGDEDELADAYEARKSFAYGMDGKAKKNAGLLQAALKDVDLAYQNLESVELGVTTVDHYFDTLGGISRAVKRAKGGKEAPVYIGDQTRGEGKVRTLQEQVALETRSRSLNPKWFEGLLKHGHEGVRQIEAQVTNTLGWSATTGQVEPWVYQRLRDLRAGRGDAPSDGGVEPAGLEPGWRTACLRRSNATTGSPTTRRSPRFRLARTNWRTRLRV
jgi:magnesium chelatase subunit H